MKSSRSTNIDQAIFRMAGTFILVSLTLSQLHHPAWLLLTAFVGLNMFQASFTGFCPAATVFKWIGFREGCAFAATKDDAGCCRNNAVSDQA